MPRMEHVTSGWWEKTCSICKRTFLVEAKGFDNAATEFIRLKHFTGNDKAYDYLQPSCRDCNALRCNATKSSHGLNAVQKLNMIKDQNNTCPGCHRQFSETVRPCVDHCHIHGNVRAVVCDDCNVAMGRTRDDPNTLRRLAMLILKSRPIPKPSVITSKKGNGYAHRKHK